MGTEAYLSQSSLKVNRFAFAFVALVVASVLTLGAAYLIDSYHGQFSEAGRENSQIAYALSQHVDDSFTQIEVLSMGVSERLEVEGIDRFDRARMNLLFKKQVASIPQLAGVFVYDASGRWLSTDKDSYPVSANNSDREYFVFHKNHPDDNRIHIGPVIKSRSTGDLVIPVSRRINGVNGAFAGIFLATLRLDYLTRYYDQFTVKEGSVVVLSLADGTVLARSPYVESMIGQSLAAGKIFTNYLPSQRSGSVVVPSVLEKIDKLFSYQLTDRYSLFLAVGVTKTSLMRPWIIKATIAAVVIGLMLLGLAMVGHAMLRHINFVVRAENELKLAQSALQKLVTEDPLTGLFNRRHLDALLPIELSRARRNGSSLGMIMIDIDYFKRFNDTYGHVLGDKCISDVSNAVVACIRRPSDFAVRYGGEEIAAVLPETDELGTFETASRIRNAIHGLGIAHDTSPFKRVTVSVGWVTICPQEDELPPAKLVSKADEALYEAKGAGRNTVFPVPYG